MKHNFSHSQESIFMTSCYASVHMNKEAVIVYEEGEDRERRQRKKMLNNFK